MRRSLLHNPASILILILGLLTALGGAPGTAASTAPSPSMQPCAGPAKAWDGIHLGNMQYGNGWDDDPSLFDEIDPKRCKNGIWPAVIAVMSEQIYDLTRASPGEDCYITSVTVKPNRALVYDYLRRAALRGTRIVTRIRPSAGNFTDWQSYPNWTDQHYLVLYHLPDVGSCHQGDPPSHRDPPDIAREMGLIHQYNVEQWGFSEFGFEPANEPTQSHINRLTIET